MTTTAQFVRCVALSADVCKVGDDTEVDVGFLGFQVPPGEASLDAVQLQRGDNVRSLAKLADE